MNAHDFDTFPSSRSAILRTIPRALWVVEFRTETGHWLPLCGDAYQDESEARRVSERSGLVTRVVKYTPAAECA